MQRKPINALEALMTEATRLADALDAPPFVPADLDAAVVLLRTLAAKYAEKQTLTNERISELWVEAKSEFAVAFDLSLGTVQIFARAIEADLARSRT